MATAYVIHDGEGHFLSMSGRRWVAEYPDAFQGTWPNCVRLARQLSERPERVVISGDYGLVSQSDRELDEAGDLGPVSHPNELQGY